MNTQCPITIQWKNLTSLLAQEDGGNDYNFPLEESLNDI